MNALDIRLAIATSRGRMETRNHLKKSLVDKYGVDFKLDDLSAFDLAEFEAAFMKHRKPKVEVNNNIRTSIF